MPQNSFSYSLRAVAVLACSAALAATQAATNTQAATKTQRSDAAATPSPAAKIQWFGVLEHALAEAERSGRPILVSSAAPQCAGVPGMW